MYLTGVKKAGGERGRIKPESEYNLRILLRIQMAIFRQNLHLLGVAILRPSCLDLSTCSAQERGKCVGTQL
jgi:hypothetical protein